MILTLKHYFFFNLIRLHCVLRICTTCVCLPQLLVSAWIQYTYFEVDGILISQLFPKMEYLWNGIYYEKSGQDVWSKMSTHQCEIQIQGKETIDKRSYHKFYEAS